MDELQSLVDLALSDGAVSDAEMNHLRSRASDLPTFVGPPVMLVITQRT